MSDEALQFFGKLGLTIAYLRSKYVKDFNFIYPIGDVEYTF